MENEDNHPGNEYNNPPRKKFQFTEEGYHEDGNSYIVNSQKNLQEGTSDACSDDSCSDSSDDNQLTRPKN